MPADAPALRARGWAGPSQPHPGVREDLVDELSPWPPTNPASRSRPGDSAKQDAEIDRNAAAAVGAHDARIDRCTASRRAGHRIAGKVLWQRARLRLAVGLALRVAPAPMTRSRRTACRPVPTDTGGHPGVPEARTGTGAGLRSPREEPRRRPAVGSPRGAGLALPVPSVLSPSTCSERPDGTRTVVSHFNKAPQGRTRPGAGVGPQRT